MVDGARYLGCDGESRLSWVSPRLGRKIGPLFAYPVGPCFFRDQRILGLGSIMRRLLETVLVHSSSSAVRFLGSYGARLKA